MSETRHPVQLSLWDEESLDRLQFQYQAPKHEAVEWHSLWPDRKDTVSVWDEMINSLNKEK